MNTAAAIKRTVRIYRRGRIIIIMEEGVLTLRHHRSFSAMSRFWFIFCLEQWFSFLRTRTP